jgi:site-specific DNA-methyltransferase (adenine-specific)
MQGKKLDLMITDPPYNVDYVGKTEAKLKIQNDKMGNAGFYNFLLDFHKAGLQYTKDGGAWYVWHAESEGINFRLAFADSGLMIKQCLIWSKNTMVLGRQDYQWKHEPCLYGWKPGAAHYFTEDRKKITIIDEDPVDFNKMSKKQLLQILKEMTERDEYVTIIREDKPAKSRLHPTMKPVKLLAPLVKNSSKVGEIVGDGFIGSGTTMVTSHQLDRVCYAIELDPKYIQVTIHRMIKLDPKLEVRINGEPMTREQMDHLVNE